MGKNRYAVQKKGWRWRRLRAAPAAATTVPAVQFKQAKQLDWELLKLWAHLGEIHLKYLDEAGCYCQSPTDYGYTRKGQQKRIEQRRRRGRRINILGVFQPKQRFDYALMIGTLKSKTYLRVMDWQAQQAQQQWQSTGQMTVIVLDNASVHRSKLAKSALEGWQQQGLFLLALLG